MANTQQFEIVELSETFIAGLALRTNNKIEQELTDRGWIAKTWKEVREAKRYAMPAAAYTSYSSGSDDNFTMVIGSERKSAQDVKAGEVITIIPAGKYASFCESGAVPDVVLKAWQAVWRREDTTRLCR